MKRDFLHLKSPKNWINDPNGFIYYKGKYHLFYQHFPYAPVWGTMHWGHAVSEDLVNWEHQEISLFPTKAYDRNGIFSGSAIEKDGKLYLYYSAVRYLEEQEENIHIAKTGKFETSQAMLISEDGEYFDNWNGKKQIIPVIRDPEIADAADTRDPKVWEEDGRYYMVLGSTCQGKTGRVLVFSSEDGENWEYLSQCRNENYGHTMECPDLFTVDEQRVFIGSPMGIRNDGLEYANHSVCAFAEFDPKTGRLELSDQYRRIDWGGDIYAPQTNLDEEGRRVLIAWMRMPQSIEEPDGKLWNGMMCLPRVVEVQDGKICFRVHPNVRKELCEKVKVTEALESGKPFCVKTEIAEGENINIGGFCIKMEKGCICTDRSRVFVEDKKFRTDSTTPFVGEKAFLEIFVEPNLVEIFVNDGEYVLSNVVYGLGSSVDEKVSEGLTRWK